MYGVFAFSDIACSPEYPAIMGHDAILLNLDNSLKNTSIYVREACFTTIREAGTVFNNIRICRESADDATFATCITLLQSELPEKR